MQTMVSDMTDETTTPGEVLHPGTRAIFRHWEAIRGEAAAPHRSDIDLNLLRRYVPWLFIMERSPRQSSYVWRLAGSKICELWRYELTGSDAFAGWDPFERDTIRRLFDGVTTALQPCALRVRLVTSLGQFIGTEFICLPIRARDANAVHIFGAAMPFRDPSSLAYDRLTAIELVSARTIWTEPVPGIRFDPPVPPRPTALQVIPGGRN